MDRDGVEIHNLAKKERGPYPAILTEKAWLITDLLFHFRKNFFLAVHGGESRAGRIAPSCPLGQPITARDLVHLARSRSKPNFWQAVTAKRPLKF